MLIKKIGHCCLLIRTDNIAILTDPGAFTSDQNSMTGIDLVLITHEHGDHLHVESLKEILKNNPEVKVITNSSVGKILTDQDIPFELLEGTQTTEIKNTLIEAFDGKHEEIYEEFGQVQNTGYFIENRFYYPGDSFSNPGIPVEILALPVAGPWCKISDAIRYALSVRPKKAFPVHDGLIKKELVQIFHRAPQKFLQENGIDFVAMNDGEEREF